MLFTRESESLWIELDHYQWVDQFEAVWFESECVYINNMIDLVRPTSNYTISVNGQ